ncbi:MAG: methylmalonyl-CoA mutase, partial [Cyanobacteria bacterium HKST-UBA02]|nr:methylmalonyl-CoA mutase [Cyanobacteria bacterium HKST-UBA02]
LTDEMERRAEEYFTRIEEIGGVIAGIEKHFFQKEIQDAAYRFEQQLMSGDRHFIGLNSFKEKAPGEEIEILKIGPEYQERQTARLARLREKRDNEKVANTLENLKTVLRDGKDSFTALLDCVNEYATLGEISDAMREVLGAYRETAVL